MPKIIRYFPGERYGKLIFIEEIKSKIGSNGYKKRFGEFLCDCGNICQVYMGDVRSGHTKSCGCLVAETTILRSTIHGKSKGGKNDPLYQSWLSMNRRTSEKYWVKNPSYTGVLRDERWMTFQGFIDNPPSGEFEPGKVLARTGDIGNYSPENCRWASKSENLAEYIEHSETKLPDGRGASKVAAEHGIPIKQWWARVNVLGWDIERAVTTPIKSKS